MLREILLGLRQLGTVGLGFKVEIDRWARLGHLKRQCGLPNLARTEQRNRWRFGQGCGQCGEKSASNHPCNYGVKIHNCKDDFG